MTKNGMPGDDPREIADTQEGPGSDATTRLARRTGASSPDDGRRPGAALPGQLTELVHDRIDVGMNVVGSEGDSIGVVGETSDNWFRVDTAAGIGGVMYIPKLYIEDVARDRVVLNQPTGLLYDMNLAEPPDALASTRRSEHEQRAA